LLSMNCYRNNLTFATLPVKQTKWIDYNTVPQANISISKSIGIGGQIDLTSQYSVNGNITSYKWKVKGFGAVLVEGTDYTITNGNTTFLKTQTDSVYCEMTNAVFPQFVNDYALKTTNVKILSGSSPTEVDKANNNGIIVYPNPITDFLNIKLEQQDLPVVIGIYNLNGQQLMSFTMVDNTSVINMQQFTSGIYLLKMVTPSQIIERKIIKQ